MAAARAPLHWKPSQQAISSSSLEDFRKYVNKKYGLSLKPGDFWSMHKWSIASAENINDFYNALWDWSGVVGDKGAQPVSLKAA